MTCGAPSRGNAPPVQGATVRAPYTRGCCPVCGAASESRHAVESLIRAGEAILYARRPVRRFLDVGTGPGYLLDSLERCFPTASDVFHGVELFPPEEHTRNPNYIVGDVASLTGTFDAGVCIEVVEHLTPHMLARLAQSLAAVSAAGSLWLFNTGMPDYVVHNDPSYLDPLHRGHIVSYGLAGLQRLFTPHGFKVSGVPGKNYAWIAEYCPGGDPVSFEDRTRHPLQENAALLQRNRLVYQVALASALGGVAMDLAMQRTRWAQGLDEELNRARELYAALRQEVEAAMHSAPGARTEGLSLSDERDRLVRELSIEKAAHARVLASRSWRLTKPLRTVASWLRGGHVVHDDRS